MDKTLQGVVIFPVLGLLQHFLYGFLQTMGFLTLLLFPELFLCPVRFLPDSRQTVRQIRLLQQHLRGRIDLYRFQLLDRALGKHVKAADGFHLIPPQLDAVRIFLRQIIDVDDIPADGKLPPVLHLKTLFIAHGHQLPGNGTFLGRLPLTDRQDHALHDRERDLGRHQGRQRSDHRHRTILRYSAQHLKTLGLQLLSPQIRLIEDQILGGKKQGIPVIKAIILPQLPGPLTAVGQDHLRPAAGRQRRLSAKRMGQLHLLGFHTAVRPDSRPRLFQTLGHIPVFF